MFGEKGRGDQTWEGEIERGKENGAVKMGLFRFGHFSVYLDPSHIPTRLRLM